MVLSDSEVAERISQGSVHCIITLEVAGKPAEHVDKSLTSYIDMLKKEKNLTIQSVHQESAEEIEGEEGGFFSAFAEVEMLVPKLEGLISLAVNLTPASIEIIAPDKFTLSARELQNWMGEILSFLHHIAGQYREEKQKAAYYNVSVQNILKNLITVLLASGEKNTRDLARLTGVDEEPIQKILEVMKKEKMIEEKHGKWKNLRVG